MSRKIAFIKHKDSADLTADKIIQLIAKVGQQQADEILSRAIEDLAIRLKFIDDSSNTHDTITIAKHARSIAAISGQIGLIGCEKVARDVVSCADCFDLPALSATLRRLLRVGEASLSEVWQLPDKYQNE